MENYIDFDTVKKAKATNKIEKNFFKLIINSVYSKAMENFRKRVSVKLVNNEKDYLKHVSEPTFISRKIS